jgi:hypothetical protein
LPYSPMRLHVKASDFSYRLFNLFVAHRFLLSYRYVSTGRQYQPPFAAPIHLDGLYTCSKSNVDISALVNCRSVAIMPKG